MVIRIKDIPGYEDLYEMHSDGTVWTFKEYGSNDFGIFKRKLNTRIRHRNCKAEKYNEYVTLYKDGNKREYLVHRLVAITFIPNPIDLSQVNHIDGDTLNNDLSNLEWCTALYNTRHAIVNGLNPSYRKGTAVNLENKKEYHFYSLKDISSIIGHDIKNAIENMPLCRNFYGYSIKFDADDENTKYDYTDYSTLIDQKARQRITEKEKNVSLTDENNNVHRFTSLFGASEFLGKSHSFLNNLLEKHPNKRMFGGYKLKLITDDETKQYDYLDYFKCKSPKITVFSKDELTKNYFDNLDEAGQFIGLSTGLLGSILKRHPKKRMIEDHKIVFDTDEENDKYDYENYESPKRKYYFIEIKKGNDLITFDSQKEASRYLDKTETFIKDKKRYSGNHFFVGEYEISINKN